jgi:hypothetical protein
MDFCEGNAGGEGGEDEGHKEAGLATTTPSSTKTPRKREEAR